MAPMAGKAFIETPDDDPYYANNVIFGERNSEAFLGDTMAGGKSDNLYYVFNEVDTIIEAEGTGNELANRIVGYDENNIIDGGKSTDPDADQAFVSTSFVKVLTSLETVTYVNGAKPLPYWIDALLPDLAANFRAMLGSSKTFNYVYPTALPSYDTDPDDAVGFLPFNDQQKAFSLLAMNYVSSVVDLRFVPTNDANAVNTISFANNRQTGSSGYSWYPFPDPIGSDIFLNSSRANLSPGDGQFSALTMIHELGHALGLKHPFSHPQAGGGDSDPGPYLPDAEENTTWTVMSYTYSAAQFHLAYSPLDLAALQYLYGPSPTAHTSNDVYLVSASTSNFIWDGAGDDTLSAAGISAPVALYLEPGNWGFIGAKSNLITAPGQITVNFGSVIENLIGGSGNDHLYGNAANNKIMGGAGDDTIDGGAGSDVFIGGPGSDTASYEDAPSGVTVDMMTPANNTGDAAGDDYSRGLVSFATSDVYQVKLTAFAPGAGGWISNKRYPRMLIDINNDHKMDLVGFGEAHVFAALGDGQGGFGAMTTLVGLDGFTPFGGGWNSNDRYPRLFADINGDGRVDAVGFGEEHTYVALGKADGGFGDMKTNAVLDGFTAKLHGWSGNDRYPRFLVDLDKDGKVDVVGFGEAHVYWAKNNGVETFADIKVVSGLDGLTPVGGGWNSNDQFPRMFADVNGDGVQDVVGFGYAKVWVSLGGIDSKGSITFGELKLALENFAVNAGGWVNNTTYPRFAADMNGDGMADLVGFGEAGVYVALAKGDGTFADPQLVFDAFGRGASGGGWTSNDLYLRLLGDLNGEGCLDLVGFGEKGVYDPLAAPGGMENVIGSGFGDRLSGDNGANVITGGGGADTLDGGGGADRFVYAAVMDSTPDAPDVITDFLPGLDKIDLSLIDANAAANNDQSFAFIGSAAFTRVAGQLNYSSGLLSGDVTGDGVADFQIRLTNNPVLSASDLIL